MIGNIPRHTVVLALLLAGSSVAALADRPIPSKNLGIVPEGLVDADVARINSSGDAVGTLAGDDSRDAFVWRIRPVRIGTLGGLNSAAFGITDGGTIVGASDTKLVDRGGRVVSHAFLWDAVMHDLSGSQSWLDSGAFGVNNAGLIVGWSDREDGTRHASLWTFVSGDEGGRVASSMNDLGTLGGPNSIARAINAAGVVVGESDTEIFAPGQYPSQAFRYDAKTGMTPLQPLPEGVNGGALDINDAGMIVGWSETMSGTRATLWMPDHAPIDLGTFGGQYSAALGINNAGLIVGVATVKTLNDNPGGTDTNAGIATIQMPIERAFVYRNGHMTDLNTLLAPSSGWLLLEARDINDSGTIVGVGMYDGTMSTFRLTLPAAVVSPAPAKPLLEVGSDTPALRK